MAQNYTGQGIPEQGEGHISLPANQYSYVTQGAWVVLFNAVYPTYTILYNASTAQNDQLDYYAWLSKGTYTFQGYMFTNTPNAILTLLLDGVSVGTADTYGSEVYGVLKTITSIAVTTSGRHVLSFKAATRNASNTTGWTLGIHTFAMWRTA